MNICVIAAEYNPFHNGHRYHIKKTREKLGSETAVIGIMSGNFVQRGDFAIMDKYKRAKAAVSEGVDLVLELPVPFCLCSAEGFAEGMVYIANSLGIVTHMSFGCESNDYANLVNIAEVLSDNEIHSKISGEMRQGFSYAAARQNILRHIIGDSADLLEFPNNTLAIEYLRAMRKFDCSIVPVFIKRAGAWHNCYPQEIIGNTNRKGGSFYSDAVPRYSNLNISSGSYIRKLITEGDADYEKYMPETSLQIFRSEIASGHAPVCIDNAVRAILGRLRCLREMDISSIADTGGGLSHRIYRAIRESADFNEIVNHAKTRVYPETRIRRILMRAYLGITPDMTEQPPLYTSVLAFSNTGRALLRAVSHSSSIPIITRPAGSKKLSVPIREGFAFSVRADDLFALGYPSILQTRGGAGFRRNPEIDTRHDSD